MNSLIKYFPLIKQTATLVSKYYLLHSYSMKKFVPTLISSSSGMR